MRANRVIGLVVVALVGTACASDGGGQWAGSVTDSAGVEIVSNAGQGMWTAADAWTVEEELKIGTLEGDPDYMFGQVGFLTVDSDGRIYVLDAQAQQIKVYAADGVYEQTIGRRGGGPGELRGATFVLMAAGDTLVVPDLNNFRINRYAPDGASLGSSPIDLQAHGVPLVFAGTPSGVLVRQEREFAFPGQPEIENPQDAIVTFAADGTVLDTLLTFPAGETIRLGGSGGPEFNFFSPEPTWAVSADLKLYYAVNDDYRIGVYNADGELERVIEMPFERQLVAERDKEALMTFLEQAWTDAGVPPEAIAQLTSRVSFGEFYPAFASMRAGPEGTIWVQHAQAPSELSDEEYEAYNPLEDAGGPDWDVFDGAGRYLGVVTLPARFAPRLILGDKIYGVWRDELDVQYVMRMRVVGIREYREG
jgi:hypothetical protein